MAHYNMKDCPPTDPQQHEAVGKAFCEKLFSDPNINQKLLASNVVAKFSYFDDQLWGKGVTVDLTIDCRGDEIVIHAGPCDIKPDFEIVEARATGHVYWMGELNFMSAVTRGMIKVNGSVRMAMKLLPIVKPGFIYYRETLAEMGYKDLLAFPPQN